jgi:c-di-GMP-related signal transduction protein
LSERITDALVKKHGELAEYLILSVCFEKGDWKMLDDQAKKLQIDSTKLPAMFKEAVEWADAIGMA